MLRESPGEVAVLNPPSGSNLGTAYIEKEGARMSKRGKKNSKRMSKRMKREAGRD
jgi:5-deoxy-D-glucuronate isomerase